MVVLGLFCLIVYTRRQKSDIITETRILARKLLHYHAKVDTIRQNPYMNTETAYEFSCSYKGFREIHRRMIKLAVWKTAVHIESICSRRIKHGSPAVAYLRGKNMLTNNFMCNKIITHETL